MLFWDDGKIFLRNFILLNRKKICETLSQGLLQSDMSVHNSKNETLAKPTQKMMLSGNFLNLATKNPHIS